MGNPAVLVAQQGLSPMGIAATVTRAPSDADDTLDVQWVSPRDGQDGEEVVRERDLRWVSTSRLPAADDDALLFVDSQGDPWAFVWATGTLLTDGAALDARIDALETTRTIHGVVDATNGTPSIVEGTDFTITDNGIGDYTINFTPAFGSVPAVVTTARVGTGSIGVISAKLHALIPVTAGAARVAMYRTDVGTNIDGEFHFIAIGPV